MLLLTNINKDISILTWVGSAPFFTASCGNIIEGSTTRIPHRTYAEIHGKMNIYYSQSLNYRGLKKSEHSYYIAM